MKKILFVLLFLIILIPYKVEAYGNLSCYSSLNSNDSTTLKPGDTITLNLGVSGYSKTQYISDANFSYSYDSSIFEEIGQLKIFNNWTIYKNNKSDGEESKRTISFNIGTTNKYYYFYDTGDSLIFAQTILKVKNVSENKYTNIVAFGNNSYYTSFLLDDKGAATDIYDVNCSQKNISIRVQLPEKDDNANLKSLTVSNVKLDPPFSPDTTHYSVDVISSVNAIYVGGTCAGIKCTVKGNGTKKLVTGKNEFNIVVTAEDGTTKTYTVTINKEPPLAYLSALKIDEYPLDPLFDKRIFTYSLKLPPDLNNIEIYAVCESDDCEIEGDGVIELKENQTFTTIVVTLGEDKKTYRLNIERSEMLNPPENDDPESGGPIIFFWILFAIMALIGVYYFYKQSGVKLKISKQQEQKKSDEWSYDEWRYK